MFTCPSKDSLAVKIEMCRGTLYFIVHFTESKFCQIKYFCICWKFKCLTQALYKELLSQLQWSKNTEEVETLWHNKTLSEKTFVSCVSFETTKRSKVLFAYHCYPSVELSVGNLYLFPCVCTGNLSKSPVNLCRLIADLVIGVSCESVGLSISLCWTVDLYSAS